MCVVTNVRRPHLHRPHHLVSRRWGSDTATRRWRTAPACSWGRQASYGGGRVAAGVLSVVAHERVTTGVLLETVSEVRVPCPASTTGPIVPSRRRRRILVKPWLSATALRAESSHVSTDTALEAHRCLTHITKPSTRLRVFVMIVPR